MKKEIVLYILLIFGLFIIIFLVTHYFTLLREKGILQKALVSFENKMAEYKREVDLKEKELEEKISGLSEEKERLLKQISEIDEKLSQTQNLLAQMKQEKEKLSTENSILVEKTRKLEAQIYNLSEEKLELERRLSSLVELKRAMREVKLKEYRKRIEEVKKRNAEGLLLGNRGYLIKDGKPTVHPKFIIRVLPPQVSQE